METFWNSEFTHDFTYPFNFQKIDEKIVREWQDLRCKETSKK